MSEHKAVKLIFMISSLRGSGPVNAILEIMKIFASRGSLFEIEIVTLRPQSDNDISTSFQELNINVHQFSFLSFFQTIMLLKGAYVISSGIRADFFSALLSLFSKFKRFSILMNVPHEEFQFMFGRFIGGVVSNSQYRLLQHFGFNVICCSKSVKSAISTRLPARVPSYVIYNPLSIDVNRNANFCAKQNLVVLASVLNQRKNVLEALAMSKAYFSPVGNSIHVFGVGDDLLKLQNLAQNDDNIIFKGYSNDLSEDLERAKILVSSSFSEGLPLAVQLAILQRCICILSDIPAHEELKNLGKTVILYNLGCQKSFKSAVYMASLVKPKDLENTRKRLLRLVDHDTIFEKWTKVMDVK